MKSEAESRIQYRISTGELERRWRTVREAMKESSLDFLILQNHNNVLGGYIKWFTDLSANLDYTSTVIFPREDDMITIFHGANLPAQPSPPDWAVRGVKKRISVPALPSLDFSKYYMAEKAVEELKSFKNASIGFVGTSFISAAFFNYVTHHLLNANFIEATNMVDKIKAIKSDEEIDLLTKTGAIQDNLFQYILTRIQPGKTENEIFNDCANKVREMGATQVNIMGGSAQPGKPAGLLPPGFGNKIIDQDDQFTLLIETNGPGGLWTELQRTICLGEVTNELQEQFELCRELQKVTLDLLKPGVEPKTIWDANNAFLRTKGYPEELRIYAHGMGYDMVERPCINREESINIQARMNIAVHPSVVSEKALATHCENYLVTESGVPICLHQTPQKIFKI